MLKNFVTNFDMFAAGPILRVKGNSEFANACGGIFSLVLLILFAYIFGVGIFNMVELKSITSSRVDEMSRGDDDALTGLNVAIRLQDMHLTTLNRFLSVAGMVITLSGTPIMIPMSPCQRSQWDKIDD